MRWRRLAAVLVVAFAGRCQEPVRVSGGVIAGHIIHKVIPEFPREACEARVNGAIVLKAVIGLDGSIEELSVISGPEMLRANYLKAVRQWTYRPFLVNGQPVRVLTTIAMTSNRGSDCSGLKYSSPQQ